MARNIFSLSFVLPPQNFSIKETALKLVSLLDILREDENIFTKFRLTKQHFKSVAFDLNEGTFDENVSKLSETILKFNLQDIRQYEKKENPTIDFSRDFGFRVLLDFDEKKRKHFSISGNISSTRFCDLTIENFPIENNDYDFDWYFTVLRKTNQFLNPLYSGVNIILSQYIEMYLPLKTIYPLGWITYFSDASGIKVPNDIGFEILKEDNGEYIIATHEDFTDSKEHFFEMKDKLIQGMKKIKAYSKAYTQDITPA